MTVIIPTVPGREALLARALASVDAQLLQPASVLVQTDTDRAGPGPTRNRALAAVTTEWTAFLDDDDELLPVHLRACLRRAKLTGADLVYPQPEIVGEVPVERRVPFGFDFDPALLRRANHIPVTVVARTRLLRQVGGFPPPERSPRRDGEPQEDWGCWLALLDAGATFVALQQVTWRWHHHPGQHGGRAWTEGAEACPRS